MRDPLRVLPSLLLLGAIWGLTPALGKRLMQVGWEPLAVGALACGLSATILLAIALARGERPPLTFPYLRHYAVFGLVGFALANLFALTGLRHAPAGLLAMLLPLAPLLTVLFSALLGIERATRRRVLGTGLGLGGMALAMSPGAILPDRAALPWALLMLLTPICYATSNVLAVKLAPPRAPALALAGGTMASACLFLSLFALLSGQARLPPGWSPVSLLLLLHGTLGALSTLVYFRTLARAGGVATSQTGYLITLFGLLWGFLLFGEVPGWLTLPAAALVFGGIALVTLSPRSN